jgi:hypothetical protein
MIVKASTGTLLINIGQTQSSPNAAVPTIKCTIVAPVYEANAKRASVGAVANALMGTTKTDKARHIIT